MDHELATSHLLSCNTIQTLKKKKKLFIYIDYPVRLHVFLNYDIVTSVPLSCGIVSSTEYKFSKGELNE